jgi:hypothetical protein
VYTNARNAGIIWTEIPSLLGPHSETDDGAKTEDDYDTHPNTQVIEVGTEMDDGFGAFRESTSFNDLSNLLQPSATINNIDRSAAAGTASSPTLAPVVSAVSIDPPTLAIAAPIAIKRKAGANGAQVAKRRNTSTGRKNGITTIKKKAVGNAKSAFPKKNKNDTPDPLKASTLPVTDVSAPIADKPSPFNKVPPVKPVAQGVSPTPPVVTPATTVPAPVAAPEAQPSQSVPAKPIVQESVPPALVTSAAPTEADFKNVAQAAVSNLIMNVANSKSESTKGPEPSEKVDTSTDHVKALTGSNWVSVCAGGDASSTTSQASADKMNNRARRQNLTPDERARQNRDRNREHARNTRLRKKAYVEELKRTLTALVSQRDASELEKRHASQRELEQREVRFRVIEEFLKLRGRNEGNPARWAAILEDNFTLTLPITDFRGMVHSGDSSQQLEQVLTGVSEVMSDSNFCSAYLQGLGKGHNDISLVYNCDRKNFFMDNCTALLEFTATTHGTISEVVMKGNVRANFSPASNKLISVVMTFDTGVIMSQINHIMKVSEHDMDAAAAAAAQVAASEADAILDSLQMPHIAPSSIPTKINVVPLSSESTAGSSICDKEESSDGSDKEEGDDPNGE